jgi:CO/xanthine dehydrogenase Mo-binding subunit
MHAPTLNRRQFSAGIGAIVVAFTLRPDSALTQAAPLPGSLNTNRMLDAWIRINADGTATVFTGKVELGQGILTALAQIAAEELDLPLARLRLISGDTGLTPNEGVTAGSQSIENSGTALRLACAEARAILLELAAKRNGWSADTLTVIDGVISGPNGQKLSYGEIAAASEAELHREASGKVKPKPAGAHKIVGRSIPRQDIPAKVTGGVAYVQDMRLPAMLHGRVVRPQRYDAKLESIDEAKIKAMPGVVAVVRDGSFLGVIAEREEQAVKARAALDAALLARATPDRPVRLQWMRDDEFAWEPYGAAMIMQAKAALDSEGRIADWQYELWSNTHSTRPQSTSGANVLAAWYLSEPQMMGPPQGIPQPAGGGDRNSIPLYDFPSQRVVHHFIPEMPLRVSALRTLGAYANVFAIESFMDELALLANADPVAFRLAHLKDPRARAVIEAVAEKAGWKPGEKSDGLRGRGIGFAKYKNLACYVAVVADVEVERQSGVIAVPRMYAAVDAGLIINPDGLASQIEGGIVQSTSWTLKEEVRFDKNGIRTRDWPSYPILTMPEVPKIDIALINRPAERSLGVGEGSQGPTVAAISNAFARATGKRLRDLPFTPAKVKAALA